MPLQTPPINPQQQNDDLLESLKKLNLEKKDNKEDIETKKDDLNLSQEVFVNDLPIQESKVEGASNQELPSSEPVFNESIDSKKEFFKLMAEKIKEEPTSLSDFSDSGQDLDNEKINYSGINGKVSYYKKMVIRFSLLAAVLVLAVLYFSLVKLNITINADKQLIQDSLNFYAYSNEAQVNLDKSVKASINRVELEASDIFSSTGENSLGGSVTGKVKIINQYSKNQPLVATTRLLSSDDKVFRIKNTVNVPAGGSVEVEVYADIFSEEMAIDATKFTIPGLWAGLQDKIFAESYEKFQVNQDVKKFISQEDIDQAITNLNEKMIKQAEEKSGANNSSQENIFSVDPSSAKIEISKKVGEEADSFEVKVKNVVNIVGINNDDVVKIVKQKLAILDFDQNLSELNPDDFEYELLSFNSSKSLAEIKVNFSAKVSSGKEADTINKKYLSNLNEKQIKAYLDNFENIKSYELEFKPSFIKRSPILVDRIKIDYK